MGSRTASEENPIVVVYQESHEDMKMTSHFHNHYEIIFVADGEINFCVSNKRYLARKNDIIFISNFESHELEVVKLPYKRFYVLIKPEYFRSVINEPALASIFKQRPAHFRHVVSLENGEGSESCAEIESHIRSIYREYTCNSELRQEALNSYLHLLFIQLFRHRRSCFPLNVADEPANLILEVQKYIEDYCTEQILLPDTAKHFHISMYHLSHQFRKVTGFSFKEYLILQRLARSKDLLYYTSESITQVGILSGFDNVNHFIRMFKKHMGETPYQYRKKLMQGQTWSM